MAEGRSHSGGALQCRSRHPRELTPESCGAGLGKNSGSLTTLRQTISLTQMCRENKREKCLGSCHQEEAVVYVVYVPVVHGGVFMCICTCINMLTVALT